MPVYIIGLPKTDMLAIGNLVQFESFQTAASAVECPLGVYTDTLENAKEKYLEYAKRGFKSSVPCLAFHGPIDKTNRAYITQLYNKAMNNA